VAVIPEQTYLIIAVVIMHRTGDVETYTGLGSMSWLSSDS